MVKKPLIFLGSNANIFKIYELSISAGYTVAGIIDDDYHHAKEFNGFPIISTEEDLINNTNNIQSDYQFICVTNWFPNDNGVVDRNIIKRNKEKRMRLLSLLDNLPVDIATIISPWARVSSQSTVGKGVFIDDFAIVEPNVIIQDHVSMHPYSIIGHDSLIGRNSVIQRYCLITSSVTLEENVYLGLCSKICRSKVTLKSNTFVHPNLMLLRGTQPNEEISLVGKDLRKVYHNVVVS
jgi:hypothetical protein